MSGKKIVAALLGELQSRSSVQSIGGYDNYQYPDGPDSYSNDDSDDSPSEQ